MTMLPFDTVLFLPKELKNLRRAREVFDVKGASESSISWNCGFGLILLVVSGGYHQGVEAAVNLWEQRQKTNAHRPAYRLTVAAVTDAEARDISAMIRKRRRAAGKLGPDRIVLAATDQNGDRYSLALAAGDRVRLFRTANAIFAHGGIGAIGGQGSVLNVAGLSLDGVRLQNQHGAVGFVPWDTLRAANGRVELSYGEAVSADVVPYTTSTEHLSVMAGGSRLATRFKNSLVQSRAQEATWLIVSQQRETVDILARRHRSTGENDVTPEQIVANVARNLSVQLDASNYRRSAALERGPLYEPSTRGSRREFSPFG